MAIIEDTDNTTIFRTTIKKFTTDLAPSTSQEQDSTTWTCPEGITLVRYLVVAGGGSGGSRYSGSGGGGAGGFRTGYIDVVPGTIYTIKVGAGGSGIFIGSGHGINGGDSQFDTIVSAGGGGGGGSVKTAGLNGGSGGGSCSDTIRGLGNTPATDPPQGNDGGLELVSYASGGGGGAGGVGGDSSVVFYGGHGGIGAQSDITGSNVYYAGGGGGSGKNAGGTGGLGGGGNGSSISGLGIDGTNGLGGGGGAIYKSADAGNGGSGIVILQYDNSKALIRERQSLVNGSGNLLVMEVQT